MFTMKGKHSTAKVFTDNIEKEAVNQIQKILSHPACTNKVAIMPDTHMGKGIVIGFTCEMNNKIVPNWVGVDINCGVLGTNLGKLENIDYNSLELYIRKNIPTGMRIHDSSVVDIKKDFNWNKINTMKLNFIRKYEEKFGVKISYEKYSHEWFLKFCKKIGMDSQKAVRSLGSLGGGNHFIEIDKSKETGDYWLVIHSGSRNLGKTTCDFHANKARQVLLDKRSNELQEKIDEILSDDSNKKNRGELIKNVKKELDVDFDIDIKGSEYLEGEDALDYLIDMIFVQEYANFNREIMSKKIIEFFGVDAKEVVHVKHNFIDFDDWIIRKGSIRSYKGEKVLIPFNMKDGTLLGYGKSNKEWNNSAPHGAGRILSRSKAKKKLDLKEFENQMKGIYTESVCQGTLDEAPGAYKDSEIIEMEIQDSVEAIEHLIPVYNLKDKSNNLSWKDIKNKK